MNRCIVIKTSFEAIHNWPDCPIEEVSFLKHPHRHIFHVKMKWDVSHNDRDIEFIQAKRKVDNFVEWHWAGKNIGAKSCEMLAQTLLDLFNASFVSVFEDNENGAELTK